QMGSLRKIQTAQQCSEARIRADGIKWRINLDALHATRTFGSSTLQPAKSFFLVAQGSVLNANPPRIYIPFFREFLVHLDNLGDCAAISGLRIGARGCIYDR